MAGGYGASRRLTMGGQLDQGIWALRACSDNLDVFTRQHGCSIGRDVVAGPQCSQVLVECLFACFVERSIRAVRRPAVLEKVINQLGGRMFPCGRMPNVTVRFRP